MKKETVGHLVKNAVNKGKATLLTNDKDETIGTIGQNVKGHGWAEIIENVPAKG